MEEFEINNSFDLLSAAGQLTLGGYDVDLTPLATTREGFVRISADTNHPQVSGFVGEYWFWADGTVMQVL